MATTDARPGFRLPWSADRSEPGSPSDGQTGDQPLEEAEGIATADPEPADQEIETTMIDAVSAPDHVAAAEEVSDDTTSEATAISQPAEPSAPVAPAVPAAPVAARKPNKFMADLTKAMQVAAESARTDTLTRFTAEAKTHIEEIHTASASEAADLRKRADDDVLSIRDWSKAEIARIREETDKRINDRKAGLEGELEEHAAAIEYRIERVQARVAAFETEMEAFFQRLLAEDDPTRFAAMAESLPEPPSFDGVARDTDDTPAEAWSTGSSTPEPVATEAAIAEAVVEAAVEDEPATAEVAEAVDVDATAITPFTDEATDVAETDATAGADEADTAVDPSDPRVAALGLTPDFAAAEAEAAAFTTDDVPADDDIPLIADEALAARLAGLVPDNDAAEHATTRVVVTGLVSVASIAGFKRQLARANGVQSVGVSSGPDGEFVFAVGHDPDVAVRDLIASLPGFGARVTGDRDGDLIVTARDPESEG